MAEHNLSEAQLEKLKKELKDCLNPSKMRDEITRHVIFNYIIKVDWNMATTVGGEGQIWTLSCIYGNKNYSLFIESEVRSQGKDPATHDKPIITLEAVKGVIEKVIDLIMEDMVKEN